LIIVSGVRAAVVALGLQRFYSYCRIGVMLSALLGIAVWRLVWSPHRRNGWRISNRYATIVSADTYVGKEAGYSSFYERLRFGIARLKWWRAPVAVTAWVGEDLRRSLSGRL
jgi:hypothetical protein